MRGYRMSKFSSSFALGKVFSRSCFNYVFQYLSWLRALALLHTSLSRTFYIQLNFWDPFTRLSNRHFTCKPSSNNIGHIIFSMRRYLSRNLVVRIRRSHRRGPGSIPGVGIVLFFGESLFICWGVWPVTKALWKCLLPSEITGDESMCIS